MGLTLKQFYIPSKAYITKKLDHGTLSKLLDSSSFVVDGIYLIKEGLDRNISLFDEDVVKGYKITGYVKVDYAYAGGARAQISNIKPFRRLIRRKPAYTLNISVYGPDQLLVHSFRQKYTRINQVIDMISMQHQGLNQYFDSINIETKK